MLESLSRRAKIRSVTYLSAAFLLLAGNSLCQQHRLTQYRRLANNSYTHALSELSYSMNQMAANLEKQTCVTSPAQIAALSAEIYGQSQTARQAIGELPYAHVELEQTAAFVSKVGDYAQAVARSAADHGGYSGDELKNVGALAKATKELAATLDDMESQMIRGDRAPEELAAVERRLSGQVQSDSGSGFEIVETDFPELPTLIYDGPFSDSLQSKQAKGLEGLETVSRTRARRLAAEFLEVNPDALADGGEISGDVPAWVFRRDGARGGCTVRVTKQGGRILNMLCDRPVGGAALTRKEAVDKAKAFLRGRGYRNLTENYHWEADGALTVNFTAVQDGVVLYPDLIKVEVALDDGEIVGFEGEHYLMHHAARRLKAPKLTKKQARKAVSKALEVKNVRLALIPTPGEEEILCWECACRTESGTRCMVYLDAETGQEQKVLLLQEDASGVLVL